MVLLPALWLAAPAWADGFQQRGRTLQALEKAAVELERDLLRLEERLQYPPRKRLTVYLTQSPAVSLQAGKIHLAIDGGTPRTVVLDDLQRGALARGGAMPLQRLSLPAGRHELRATLEGTLAGQPFSGTQSLVFTTGRGPVNLRLHLDMVEAGAPRLVLEDWQ